MKLDDNHLTQKKTFHGNMTKQSSMQEKIYANRTITISK